MSIHLLPCDLFCYPQGQKHEWAVLCCAGQLWVCDLAGHDHAVMELMELCGCDGHDLAATVVGQQHEVWELTVWFGADDCEYVMELACVGQKHQILLTETGKLR